MKFRSILISIFSLISTFAFANSTVDPLSTTTIKLFGNSYVTAGENKGVQLTNQGLTNWTSPTSVVSTYFHLEKPEPSIDFAILAKGKGNIFISIDGEKYPVKIDSVENKAYSIGKISFKQAGYQKIDFIADEKSGETFPNIQEIILNGAKSKVVRVANFSEYWGRRGPSVHLRYEIPKARAFKYFYNEATDKVSSQVELVPIKEIEYFYNEVTVPLGEDVIGTYFMVNGFGEGYCGIQVNSPQERRILFSVWSPFSTDDPKKIPEDHRVILLKKGPGVYSGEFGNEGSGGQSFLRYMWKAGVTYKILTRIYPDGKGRTIYTSFFYDPEIKDWRLIASFSRPKTNKWQSGMHSFLENFNHNQGYLPRRVLFSNQWVRTHSGGWIELLNASFSVDNTGSSGNRLDFSGGVVDDKFFLKNCGFFNETTKPGTKFTRKSSSKMPPQIDFKKIENL